MIIISFDVGIKNMAVCIMKGDDILHWGLINCGNGAKANEVGKIADNLIVELDKLVIDHMESGNNVVYTVLIENQPVMKAPTMKSVQMILYTYFKILNVHEEYKIDVHLVSAMKKNSYLKQKGCDVQKEYKSYKSNSIDYIQTFLENKGMDKYIELLKTFKKKDDLCDSLLQILSYRNL